MENKYYVYVYLDQRNPGTWGFGDKNFEFQPFYVGKGTGNRENVHIRPHMLKVKSFKSNMIKGIVSETNEMPIHYRVYENITQDEAIELEIKMIKHFGRRDIKTGILTNCTDGGDGNNNLSETVRKEMNSGKKKKTYQYNLSGQFIKKWDSVTTAADELNINRENISAAIYRKGTCGDFFWSYSYLGKKIQSKKQHEIKVKYDKIQQVDIKTKKIIAEFNSAKDAAEELNLNKSARNKILDVALGRLNRHGNPAKTYKGFEWKIKN